MMDKGTTIDSKLSIDWKEALFLATRGSAIALGLQGMSGVGQPFDTQESELKQSFEPFLKFDNSTIVKLYDPTSGMGIGART